MKRKELVWNFVYDLVYNHMYIMYTENLPHIDIVYCTSTCSRLYNRFAGFLDTVLLQQVPSTSYLFFNEAPNKAMVQ
jgi:uncharacterized sodium:solute symporter family permease YidK